MVSGIKNIVIDCDGVLTDGKKYINADGDRELIAFHSRDNEAIKRLIEKGYRVIIVTASDFPGIRRRWMRYNVEVYRLKQKDLLNEIAEPGFEWSETVGVGDDLIDLPFLEKCAHAFVPMDGLYQLRMRFEEIFCNGGGGVMEHVENRIESLPIGNAEGVAIHPDPDKSNFTAPYAVTAYYNTKEND